MQIDLSNKTALVTGSTQGIGLAIATGLARAGARVAVNGRTAEKVAAAAEQLRADVPGAEVIEAAADVTDSGGTEKLLAQIPDVDVLINNLGIFGPSLRWRSPTTNGGATSRSRCSPRSG